MRHSQTAQERSVFVRCLATMLDAGIPLHACLCTLEEQSSSPAFRAKLHAVVTAVADGTPLHKALAAEQLLDPLSLAIILAGEESGDLPQAMAAAAGQLEGELKLQRAVRQATFYPRALNALVALAVLGGLAALRRR